MPPCLSRYKRFAQKPDEVASDGCGCVEFKNLITIVRRVSVPLGNFISHIRLIGLIKILPQGYETETAARLNKESAAVPGDF